MQTEQLPKCFESLQMLRAKMDTSLSTPLIYIIDHAKAVLLMWFSVLLVSVSVSVLFASSVCLVKFR